MQYELFSGQLIQIDEIDLPIVQEKRWSAYPNSGRFTVRTTTEPKQTLIAAIGKAMGIKGPVGFVTYDKLDFRRQNIRAKVPTQITFEKKVSKTGHKGIYASCGGYSVKDPRTADHIGWKKTLEEAIALQKEKRNPDPKEHCGRVRIIFNGETFSHQIPVHLKSKFKKQLLALKKLLQEN